MEEEWRIVMLKRSILAKMVLGSAICLVVVACGSATITCTATVSTESKAKSIIPTKGIESGFSAIASDGSPASIINISGTLEASGVSGLMARVSGRVAALGVSDISAFEMDVSGSSVTWPQLGNVTLTIFDKDTGRVISARSFGWIRSGSRIQFSSPADVNNWVASTGAAIDNAKVRYDLGGVEVGSAVGDNIVSTAILQDNVVRARGLTQWSIDETWHECGGGRICAPK